MLFLLLGPKIKYSSQQVDKPVLVFAQDNSKSLVLNKDSAFYQVDYKISIEKLLKEAETDFKVERIGFGDNVSNIDEINYSESNTNFSELVQFLKLNYSNTNNVQVILASDGIYNQGNNPRYLVQDVSFPIHTLQLGDTTEFQDVAIDFVRANEIGFVNNRMPVRVGVKAINFDSEEIRLNILDGNKVIATDNFSINGNTFFIEKDFILTPEKSGLQKYTVEVVSTKKEQSLVNNNYEIVVDILDTKRKVAICYHNTHPDVAAIASAINENYNFTADVYNLSQEVPNLEDYNLIVLNQVPSLQNNYSAFIQKIKLKELPLLILLGGNTDIEAINQINLGLNLDVISEQFSESSFLLNDVFNVFDISEEEKNLMQNLPPLLSPMGNYSFSVENQILSFQKIKSIETTVPQIAFSTNNNQKIAWIFGEAVWRWKLQDYRLHDSSELFNGFINRLIQYLALKVKKEQVIVKHVKSVSEGEEIHFDVEFYNESFELSNKEELSFTLTDGNGNQFNYNLERNAGAYELSIFSLPKGIYSFTVKNKDIEKQLEKSGMFIVSANNIESVNLQADEIVLSQISQLTNGKLYSLSNLSDIIVDIKGNQNAKPTVSEDVRYGNLVDVLFILIFIIIFVSLEWFLRKYWLGN